mgnify:FL=1
MKNTAPKWFRITKKIISLSTTTGISIAMLYIPEDSVALLAIKLIQSFLMEMLDSIMIIAYSNEVPEN